MVLTNAQINAFFSEEAQMGIPQETVERLQAEGIATVDDLEEFTKEDIDQIAKNFRSGANPTVFGAKSHKRIIVACEMVKFYNTVGRSLTPGNIQWDPVMKNFEIQWKALKEKKDADEPDTPKITKGMTIMKWSEAFSDFLHRCFGSRNIPLAYVIRANEMPLQQIPNLAQNMPHSESAGSVEQELIDRASHNHVLFRDDNAAVYFKLEEATRSTQFAASIKPFQKGKNGRGAYMALISQHAGHDKWNAEVKKNDTFLHTMKWKGSGNFLLDTFCAKHRAAFEQLKAAHANGIPYQIPTEHTRVGYLLEAIETSDPELQAALAAVKGDSNPANETGKRYNFEECVAFITPADPVARRRVKGGTTNVSSIINPDVSIGSIRSGIGETGVQLRYHTHKEYQTLSNDQKKELKRWRSDTPEGREAMKQAKKGPGKRKSTTTDTDIASVIEKKLDAKFKKIKEKEQADSKADAELQATIMSCLDNMFPDKPKASVSATNSTSTNKLVNITSILRRAKNASNKSED